MLLPEPRLPSAQEIQASCASFAAAGEKLLSDADPAGQPGAAQVLSLKLNSGEVVFVALMSMPVPNGEADKGVEFSLSSFGNGWKLPPHHAHLAVTYSGSGGDSPLVQLSRFTSVLAAVTKASSAVGVYWGNAGATHAAEFFVSIASDQGIAPRIMLWTGVSIARENDGRLSLLSLGMQQLSLPDLLLVANNSSSSTAFETMFDLLAYVADRGQPIGEGETVGMSAEQKLPVHYVPSPVDPARKVWRVVLD